MRSPCFYQSLFSDVMVRFTVTLLFLLMLVPAVVVGQPDSIWCEIYGTRGTDKCFAAINTSDNGILMVGEVRHYAGQEDLRAEDKDFLWLRSVLIMNWNGNGFMDRHLSNIVIYFVEKADKQVPKLKKEYLLYRETIISMKMNSVIRA